MAYMGVVRHWRGDTKRLRGLLSLTLRGKSTSVDEMLHFVRSPDNQAAADQSIDILKSGLSHHAGAQAGRLHLALAEAYIEDGRHTEAVTHAEAAHEAVASEDPEVILTHDLRRAAREIAVRGLLVQGKDSLALSAAEEALADVKAVPDGEAMLSQRWQSWTEASARLEMTHLVARGGQASQASQRSMRDVSQSVNTDDLSVAPPRGDESDPSTRPMLPRDLLVPGALLASGAWAFIQGDQVLAARCLQRAAMAAEAGRAEAEAEGGEPLAPLTRRETTLAAISGHVQTELNPGSDQQGWKRAEIHLENALKHAEAFGGSDHPRILPTLINLGDVFSHTGRATLAEGLYRKAAKMLYRNPTAGSGFARRRHPPVIHPSLEALLAWRYAQLLAALPKRGGEADEWRVRSETVATACDWPGDVETAFGGIDRLTGRGKNASGVFIHNALLRVIPCARPFVGAEVDESAPA